MDYLELEISKKTANQPFTNLWGEDIFSDHFGKSSLININFLAHTKPVEFIIMKQN